MKQKFFTNTIQSNFIKSLVYNTPIPICNTVNETSYIIKNNSYIYNNHFIKCTKSGVIKKIINDEYTRWVFKNGDLKRISYTTDSTINIATDIIYNNYLASGYVDVSTADYEILDTFHFGYYYPKYTTLYTSKFNYYDTETHIKLGNYLRCYRDIYNIDLMPFYNCACGDYVSNLVIENTEIKSKDSSSYKVFKIPVKFNTPYSIALDSNSRVSIAPILLSADTPLDDIKYVGVNVPYAFNDEILSGNVYHFNSMSFKELKVVGVNTLNKTNLELLQKYEKYLYLLIQVPSTNDSSLVVLEGDYSDLKTRYVYNQEQIENITNYEFNKLFLSNLSLLQFSDGVIYPYSNRLIEYLLQNVITNRDSIDKNIERVQNEVNMNNPYIVKGVWDKYLRNNIVNKYQNLTYLKQLDLNGFVDKDTEDIMNKY